MKTITQRIWSLLLTGALLFGILFAAPAAKADADPYSVSGTCGKENATDISWYAFSDRTMVFLGTGAMQDYVLDSNGYSTAPWFSADMSTVAQTIFSTKIVIESGVTTVGDYAFYLHPSYNQYVKAFMTISSIDLSDTVTSIGRYAFYQQEIENINIPPTVTHIGTHAFGRCTSLTDINYYGDPDALTWDHDDTEAELSSTVTCHILKSYTDAQVSSFNTKFSSIGLTFSADLENPYALASDGIDRNIALYYGATNSKVFAGAAPYIIVGKFDENKKSTTFGSNGFVSCVEVGGSYYLLTDHNGTLKLAATDSNGKATSTGAADSGLTLTVRHEYIGSDIVKVIYTLTNTSDSPISNIKLGGSGDIKIGADDRAAINPLMNTDETPRQVGFYMTSGKDFDKDSSNNYATLGFIAKNISKSSGSQDKYPDGSFFYGQVGANLSATGAGTRDKHVFPQRIFEKNTTLSHDDDNLAAGVDSGMSYYWENIELGAKNSETTSKDFAVLFSIYGNSGDGKAMIDNIVANYYTVTWLNHDGSVLQKQAVKSGSTPAYSGATPTKPNDTDSRYEHSGWTPAVTAATGDATYTATFNAVPRPFFASHSISLDGDIGVNFYVDVTTIAGLTPENVKNGTHTVKLNFSWFNKRSTYTIAESDYCAENGYFKTTCRVAPAEMMYPITATVTVDNTPQSGDKFTESYRVRDYADVILDPDSDFSQKYNAEHPDKYPQLVDLVKKMLDFGAKAQVRFNRMTDDLANADIDYSMAAHEITGYADPSMDSCSAGSLSDYGLRYDGSTLIFLSATTLRHYYFVLYPSRFETAKESVTFSYGVNGDYIYFENANIPASRLDNSQTVTIGGQTYSYTPMYLAQRMQELNRSSAEYDLATATYWYNDAANTFFGD